MPIDDRNDDLEPRPSLEGLDAFAGTAFDAPRDRDAHRRRYGRGGAGGGNGGEDREWEQKLSDFSRPLRTTDERSALFGSYQPLSDDARDKLLAVASERRISNPLALRRMAVEAAMASAQRQRLAREIESAIANVRGSDETTDGVRASAFVQAFPHFAFGILFEVTKDRDSDGLSKLPTEDIRVRAEEFFKRTRAQLYMDSIRKTLQNAGVDATDETIRAVFADMDARKVALPTPERQGAVL